MLWPIVLLFLKQIWSFIYPAKKTKTVDDGNTVKETISTQENTVVESTQPFNYTSDMVWEEVISEDVVKVFRFTAKWCKPCKTLDPIYEELSLTTSEVVFYNVDVDECDEVAAINGAIAIPLFVTYRGGKQISKLRSSDVDEITQFIKDHADIAASQ